MHRMTDKNGFSAAQKSFSLQICPYHMMIKNKLLTSALERRKTFDSPLVNHFLPVMQALNTCIIINDKVDYGRGKKSCLSNRKRLPR
jgi:hypothetical protein